MGCYRLFSWLARELLDNRLLCLPNAKRCILRWNWIDYIIITSTVGFFALFCWIRWQTTTQNLFRAPVHTNSCIWPANWVFSVHLISIYHSIDFKCNRMLDSIFILTYLCQLKINTANRNVMSFSQPRDISNWLFLDIEDHLYMVYMDIGSWPI